MLIDIIAKFKAFDAFMFSWLVNIIDKLTIADFLKDALIDSIKIIPFLFIIFLLIELSENYFCNKISKLSNYSKGIGPLIGGLLASMPQCGFSIIASTLYVRNLITKGTLIAVYISTSDEAIPILLANPDKLSEILPLIATKVFLAILTGYLVDLIFKEQPKTKIDIPFKNEEGCCKQNIFTDKNIWWHPIKHTFSIFVFVLLITVGLNYLLFNFGNNLDKYLLTNSLLQPIVASFIGLIPNCAVSVLITMLYIKNAISFGSVIAGLSSGAGLGLLVLIRKNSTLKDTLKIILILLFVSSLAGILLQMLKM